MNEAIAFAQFIASNVSLPVLGWLVAMLAGIYIFRDNKKAHENCLRELRLTRRMVNALSQSNSVMRQNLIAAGQMKPQDDADAQRIIREISFETDPYPAD